MDRYTKFFAIIVFSSLFTTYATGMTLLVPAYANPGSGDGPAMWNNIASVGTAGTPDITFILNPASGPGSVTEIDPNYINVGGVTGALLDATASGATSIAYVATGYASKSLTTVLAEIDLYLDASYWRGAGVQIEGFFFDEVSNDLANLAFYQSIQSHVDSKGLGLSIMGNPGVGSTFDSSGASGFTEADYVNTFDTLVTFEQTGSNYRTAYTDPTWLGTVDDSHFAHIVHSETLEADMLTDVALAQSRGAGFLYVTDDPLSPNPFDNTPSYWNSQVAAIAAVPEPSSIVLFVIGVAGCCALRRRN